MPCNSITTQSVNLSNATGSILADALRGVGWTITEQATDSISATTEYGDQTVVWTKGQGIAVQSMGDAQSTISDITQAYSARAVSWAAKRAGWTVAQTTENTLSLTRR